MEGTAPSGPWAERNPRGDGPPRVVGLEVPLPARAQQEQEQRRIFSEKFDIAREAKLALNYLTGMVEPALHWGAPRSRAGFESPCVASTPRRNAE